MQKIKLRFVICPGSHPDQDYLAEYTKIFDCWKSVWGQAYAEMKFENRLYSDAFTRQDYVGAIFLEERCLAVCLFRWAQFDQPDFATDSYFSLWVTGQPLGHKEWLFVSEQ